MDRAEYMRLKGEETMAAEARTLASVAVQEAHLALQSFVNRARLRPLTEPDADAGADLVRALFLAQKKEAYWRDQHAHFRKALEGIDAPSL